MTAAKLAPWTWGTTEFLSTTAHPPLLVSVLEQTLYVATSYNPDAKSGNKHHMHETIQSFTVYIKVTDEERCFITHITNGANFASFSLWEKGAHNTQ